MPSRLLCPAPKFMTVLVRPYRSISLLSPTLLPMIMDAHVNGWLNPTMKQPPKPLGMLLPPPAAQFIITPRLGSIPMHELLLQVLMMKSVRLVLGHAMCTTIVCLAGVTLAMTLQLVRQV